MMLSTKGRYAVMAMVDLACQPQDKPMALASIAERQEIPLAYLEQIFMRLKRAGLVRSVRGPGGGYQLARAASQLSIAAIMEASEEPLKMTRCNSHREEGCMALKARCLTHDLWQGLSDQIEQYLEQVTLEDVVKKRVARVQRAESSKEETSLRGAQRRGNPSFTALENGLLRFARNDDQREADRSTLATSS